MVYIESRLPTMWEKTSWLCDFFFYVCFYQLMWLLYIYRMDGKWYSDNTKNILYHPIEQAESKLIIELMILVNKVGRFLIITIVSICEITQRKKGFIWRWFNGVILDRVLRLLYFSTIYVYIPNKWWVVWWCYISFRIRAFFGKYWINNTMKILDRAP